MEDAWRTRLKEVIEADPRSLRAISRESGNGENYVQQMLKDEKDPSFPRLAKVLHVLGTRATLYVINGSVLDEEQQLRSALLAFGVDREDLGRAVSAVKVFVDDPDGQSSQDLPDDQSGLSSPRREEEPSR